MPSNIAHLGIQYVTFLFALCFHEFAHAWVAKLKGDRTAELMGRLNLNPMSHGDLMGTFVLPIVAMAMNWSFLFGWAKPVPVNDRNFRHPRKDMFWVASAGPLANILLGSLGVFVYVGMHAFQLDSNVLRTLLRSLIGINFSLAIFNLIPIHPLDGAKVLARFLPESINEKLENHQQMMSMILLLMAMGGALPFLIGPPVIFLINICEQLAVNTIGLIR